MNISQQLEDIWPKINIVELFMMSNCVVFCVSHQFRLDVVEALYLDSKPLHSENFFYFVSVCS